MFLEENSLESGQHFCFERCLDHIREHSLRCFYTNFRMGKEKKTGTVRLERHEAGACPLIVGEVKKSIPRMRAVKSKEKMTVTTTKSSSTADKCTTTCETSGNIMKLCVNLMPVLASAKEPEEVDKKKEEHKRCPTEQEPENSSKKDPSVSKSVEPTVDRSDSNTGLTLKEETGNKLRQSPGFVLPPLTHNKPAPVCRDHQKTKRYVTLVSPTIFPNLTTKDCSSNGDSRPWIDNPLFSKSRSAEFRLPDISLSSLDALLQTVTQKLGGKRRGSDEGPWRRVHYDNLLMAVNERRLREKISCCAKDENHMNDSGTAAETSVRGHSVNREMSLPPLFSAPKRTLILNMTKKTLQ